MEDTMLKEKYELFKANGIDRKELLSFFPGRTVRSIAQTYNRLFGKNALNRKVHKTRTLTPDWGVVIDHSRPVMVTLDNGRIRITDV